MTQHDPASPAPDTATTVAIRTRWTAIFPLVGAIIGLIAAFIIGPVVAWLLNLIGDAPGPMRLAALLPLAWAIPVLMVIGAVVGFIFLAQWHEEAGRVLIDARGITVDRKHGRQLVTRDNIREVFTDGHDLVILGVAGRELLRTAIDDELATQLAAPLGQYSYPYLGVRDPREDDFVVWVDGEEALEAESETLLRDRHRAKLDEKPGRMQELTELLAQRDIAVRDRNDEQQYRVAGAGE